MKILAQWGSVMNILIFQIPRWWIQDADHNVFKLNSIKICNDNLKFSRYKRPIQNGRKYFF